MEAVTGWDFADGAWLGAPTGLIRKDNSIKPSYEALYRLIHEEWTTKKEAVTDADGMVQFDGYRGSYELECEGAAGSFQWGKNPGTVPVVFGGTPVTAG